VSFHEQIGDQRFTFRKFTSPKNKEAIYRLRYQVYCQECAFIRAEDHPQGLEHDSFDHYSAHFAAMDNQGMVGTVRLILNSDFGFPIQDFSQEGFNHFTKGIPKRCIGEISRLVISKNYQRRTRLSKTAMAMRHHPVNEIHPRQYISDFHQIAAGMYRMLYQECMDRDLTHTFALMARSLVKLLRLQGFDWQPIGKEVDFFGPVRPYMLDLKTIGKVFPDNVRNKHVAKYLVH